jgi:myosin-5
MSHVKPADQQRKSIDRRSSIDLRRLSLEQKNSSQDSIENQVLLSTPLLEAFGNAKTLRNDNSSRFGKFIEIQFNSTGAIIGADIHTYLLEKSRVTKQTTGERNFHIFYQLCAACDENERAELLENKQLTDFIYLSQSGCSEVPGVSDLETFKKTKQALTTIGITDQEQQKLKRVLAAILHFGNIKFQKLENDSAKIIDEAPLKKACELLQLDSDVISQTFLTRKVIAGRETMTTPLKVEQAESSRDALAMLLYSKLFDWVVTRINENINKPALAKHTVGILDIYGFESFDVNSFEQFCINYANEKLQQQFYQHIFKLSQEEYLKEKINWSNINFNDNQVCLDLIENSPLCILKILDEECNFPRSNEKTFAEKLFKHHQNHPSFSRPKISQTAFTVNHYVDSVTYDTTYFLNKNKDYIVPEQIQAIQNSDNEFLKTVFEGYLDGGGSKQSSSFKFTSVVSQFKDSLAMLMDKLTQTYPHYIRCIKPNSQKKANSFNFDLVLHQLKCGGILEAIRICLEGYPAKKIFLDFIERYKIIYPKAVEMDPKLACQKILEATGIEQDKFQLGITKVFLRSGQIERIEMARTTKLNNYATAIQKNVRRMIGVKKWRAIRTNTIEIEKVMRMKLAQQQYQTLREEIASRTIGQVTRKSSAVNTMEHVLKSSLRSIQCMVRSNLEKKVLEEKRRELKLALTIQSIHRHQLRRDDYLIRLAEAKRVKALEIHATELKHKVSELDDTLTAANIDRRRLSERLSLVETQKHTIESQYQTSEKEWNRRHTALADEFGSVKTELEVFNAMSQNLELQLRGTKSQLSRNDHTWSQKYSELFNEYNRVKDGAITYQQQLKELRDKYTISDRKLSSAKNTCLSLSQTLESISDSLVTELELLKQKNNSLSTQYEQTKMSLDHELRIVADLENKILTIQTEGKRKDEELKQLEYALVEQRERFKQEQTKTLSDTQEMLQRQQEELIRKQQEDFNRLLASQSTHSMTDLEKREQEIQLLKNRLEEESLKLTSEVQLRYQTTEELSQLQKENDLLMKQMNIKLEEVDTKRQQVESEYQLLTEKHIAMQSQFDSLRLAAEKDRDHLSVYAPELARYQQMCVELENQNHSIQSELEFTRKHVESSRSANDDSNTTIWKQKYNHLESQNQHLQETLNSLQQENSDLEQRLSQIMGDSSSLQSTLMSIEQNWKNKQATIQLQNSELIGQLEEMKILTRDLNLQLNETNQNWNDSDLTWRRKYKELEQVSSDLQQQVLLLRQEMETMQQQQQLQLQPIPAAVSAATTMTTTTSTTAHTTNNGREVTSLVDKLKIEKDKRKSLRLQMKQMKTHYDEDQNEIFNQTSVMEKELKSQITQLENEKNSMMEQYNTMKQLCHNLESQLNKEKQELTRLKHESIILPSSMMTIESQIALEELNTERERRRILEEQVLLFEREKSRVLQRREQEMQWDINKYMNVFSGSKQERAERFIVYLLFESEREIYSDVLPTSSFLIYHMIKLWNNDEEGCERLLQLVENLLKAVIGSSDDFTLPYWFSNIASLLQLCTTEDFLTSIQPLVKQQTPQQIRQFVLNTLANGEYKTFDQEFTSGNESNDNITHHHHHQQQQQQQQQLIFTRFIHQLTQLFMNSYTELIYNCYDELCDLIKAHIIDRSMNEEKRRSTSSTPLTPTHVGSYDSIGVTLKAFIQSLRRNKLSENIIEKATQQLFTFIDVTLFNEILFRKDICSSSRGIQLRSKITQLENDLYKWSGMRARMNLVFQVISLLLTDKKVLLNEQVRMKLMPNLNSLQILKLLRMYNLSEFESNIPSEVYEYFAQDEPALVPIYSKHTVILDPKQVQPFKSFDELENELIKSDIIYLSFPIPIKHKLDIMAEEQLKKREQEQLAKLLEVVNTSNMEQQQQQQQQHQHKHKSSYFWGSRKSTTTKKHEQ